MKQTKKLTRSQRELVMHNRKIKDTSDYRAVNETKDILVIIDSKGELITINKNS
jgi:hypothetical protein